MQILVLEHEREAPAGLLADWAAARGHSLRVLEVPSLERWPQTHGVDAIVSLGSESSVCDPAGTWIGRELDFLREAHLHAVPLLGICFGAQALAAALGGQVTRARQLSVELSQLEWSESALIPSGPWLRWHEDVFSLPPGARELAGSGVVPLAFAVGRSVGVQFHPEADARIASGWIAASHDRREDRQHELEALEQRLERDASGIRARAMDLFDRVARHWRQS